MYAMGLALPTTRPFHGQIPIYCPLLLSILPNRAHSKDIGGIPISSNGFLF